ncbi:HAD family hydrolase [Gracilibacillus alcaliphilus]|uniref:HAD family hydrolase n=1 Tax=Gracilibacillus alcaliphilus TaxID=1401441 RepID=UPI001958C481|nr:HAD family hydrolase [Gracilibacillus alcaliphilus]MBM7677887.1 putative hydrolase of the HAD superfamily [Gracilibacillus alcaliphilus]
MPACIILDLDDTLCDYQQAKENAKQKINDVLSEVGVSSKQFWDRYDQFEPALFKQFTEKRLNIREYRYSRFAKSLPSPFHQSKSLIESLNKTYMDEANQNIELFPDADAFLEKIKHTNIQIAILTNGPTDGQRIKIAALGIETYTSNIYISAEIGVAKPDQQAFQYVLDDLDISASRTWMIGDSVKYDLEGAKQAGIKGILVDRQHRCQGDDWAKVDSLMDIPWNKIYD